jgi:hypothetical protein
VFVAGLRLKASRIPAIRPDPDGPELGSLMVERPYRPARLSVGTDLCLSPAPPLSHSGLGSEALRAILCSPAASTKRQSFSRPRISFARLLHRPAVLGALACCGVFRDRVALSAFASASTAGVLGASLQREESARPSGTWLAQLKPTFGWIAATNRPMTFWLLGGEPIPCSSWVRSIWKGSRRWRARRWRGTLGHLV